MTLLLVGMVGAIDALVDPYLVVGAPRIAEFNAVKPEAETHTRLAKDHLFARARPAGLFLGASEVDIGLDPQSPSWPQDARPAFNYGLPGTNLTTAAANLRSAVSRGTIKRVLVMIDLTDLMAPIAVGPQGEHKLAASPISRLANLRQRASDVLLATLSLDALRDSIATVAAQGRRDPVDLSAAGSTSEGGFRAIAAMDGYHALFAQKDAYLAAKFSRVAAAVRARPDSGFNEADSLKEIISICRRHGVALDLAIGPHHADYLEVVDQAGLWPRYEQVKRELTRLVDAAGGGRVRLWDFLGYDVYSTESVPGASDRSGSTQWFWEPSHFKRVLGEKIFATIYRGRTGYGGLLSPTTISEHLRTERQAKAAYQGHEPLQASSGFATDPPASMRRNWYKDR